MKTTYLTILDESLVPSPSRRCPSVTPSSSVAIMLKFTFGAALWQVVFSATYSASPLLYISCCLLTGLADGSVNALIDTVFIGLHSGHTRDTLKQVAKNLVNNTLVSGLWLPVTDLGAVVGGLIVDSTVSANICSGFFLLIAYTILYHYLQHCDANAARTLTGVSAQIGFFICGPLTLPYSPSGSRIPLYAGSFALAGAASGELVGFFVNRRKEKNQQSINAIANSKWLVSELTSPADEEAAVLSSSPASRPTPCCVIL